MTKKKIVLSPEEVKKIEEVTVPRDEIVAEMGEEKVKKIEEEAEEVEVIVEEAEEVEVIVEEPAVATGDFHKIKRGDKFVVVNRLGQIVSQPMNEVIAQEMVQRYQGLTR